MFSFVLLTGHSEDVDADGGCLHVQEFLHHPRNVPPHAVLRSHRRHPLRLRQVRRRPRKVDLDVLRDVSANRAWITSNNLLGFKIILMANEREVVIASFVLHLYSTIC